MTTMNIHTQVGQVVADNPARSRVFERHAIDYCCGGKRTVEDACRREGLDPTAVLVELEAVDGERIADHVNPAGMTMTELADHIESTHHAYLRAELPRLEGLIHKVVAAHGSKYAWLEDVRATYAGLVAELEPHMLKEEQILFPIIRQLGQSEGVLPSHCGTVGNPIKVMEHEHDNAAKALRRLRVLTSDFTPPGSACNSFRAMLDGLATLEADLHQHIHEENNVLFVRALEAER